ncbi:MAG: UvrB/UvrC motif-containing protein [Kiritimatiellae bacterium]|nr:UvrB/UvrC motif-containing protein [Kiritimatiellia bacterium]
MLCDKCQKAPAAVHLTQVVDGQVKKIHLCEACAAKSGIDLQKTMSVTDVLMGLDHLVPETGTEKTETDSLCPECGISRAEYKRRGRLGCAACYEAFSDDLIPMIRAVHHHLQHGGKKPHAHAVPVEEADFSGDLKAALAKAVEAEDYETAAHLRDQMKDGNPSGRERHGT